MNLLELWNIYYFSDKQDVQEFITQIGATPSNYEFNGEVPETILGCWTETGENEYGTTNCWDRYDKSASLGNVIYCTNIY